MYLCGFYLMGFEFSFFGLGLGGGEIITGWRIEFLSI